MDQLVTLLAVIVGAVAAAGGGYLSQRALAQASHRQRWADQAAATLADVQMVLTDLNPLDLLDDERERLGFPPDTQDAKARRFDSVLAATRDGDRVDRVRREVAILASGHPEPQVREEATRLQATLSLLLDFMRRAVDELGKSDQVSPGVAKEAMGAWNDGHSVRHWLVETLQR